VDGPCDPLLKVPHHHHAFMGFLSDRASYGAGFAVAGVTAILGLLAFLASERRHSRRVALAVGASSID
jgi:dipeptide/tripeptide permease